jgi:4-hydroxythreonine-4-phosphate dehydrogenase
MTAPRIGVTLGDPGGVGPEVVLKALAGPEADPAVSYVVFGSRRVLSEEARALGIEAGIEDWRAGESGGPGRFLSDVSRPGDKTVRGRPDPGNGEASFRSFEAAVGAAGTGLLDALVTAPVSKAAWSLAGIPWRGHTEYLESLYPGAVMSFWSDRLRVALLSHHLPLREALERVGEGVLLEFFRSLARSAGRVPGGPREFLVAGLNPHAGEGGLLGIEEEREVRPAVEKARGEGLPFSGPYPPDTVFIRALDRPQSMVVALYHDQGLIPFKLEAFRTGVNVTLGLPFARTSPDHGTAFDIAGKGSADPSSMARALRLAGRLIASAS